MITEALEKEYFVERDSVVRKIWGKSDIVLFIFAGASAEFALNRAVDWLYFTGRLPADPIARLFSTVSYAKKIIFSKQVSAYQAIDAIAAIHSKVEDKRGSYIPEWAYRDVLFLLIDYSIRAYEILERKLTHSEKEDVFYVFKRFGTRMKIDGLPETFTEWQIMRQEHLEKNLNLSHYTYDLYSQYRKHLGPVGFRLLLEVQKLILPQTVMALLNLKKIYYLQILIKIYKSIRNFTGHRIFILWILPPKFKQDIYALDR